MPKLLGYVRKSIIEDDRTASPARQRAAQERYAARTGRNLVIYEDLDYSGRFEANRPGWQSLLVALDDPDVAGIIVESIDRSHRNVREFLDFYDNTLEPRNQTLISTTQNIDMATADGRMVASVLMAFAEAESRKAGERMANHVRHIVEEQHRHWGPCPFGTERDPDSLHLIPAEKSYFINSSGLALPRPGPAELPGYEIRYYHDSLRACFELYAGGRHSYTATARALNEAGWRFWDRDQETPKPWNRVSVRSAVLRWELYAGELPPSPSAKTAYCRSRPTLEAGHGPILPVELCRAVGQAYRARSGDRQPGSIKRSTDYVYLLTGILYCGRCGQRLSGQHSRRRNKNKPDADYRWYRHQNSKMGCPEQMTAVELLEQPVLVMLLEIIQHQEILEGAARELEAIFNQLAVEEVEDGQATLAELDQKKQAYARLIDLYTDGLITKAEFSRRRDSLAGEIAQLEAGLGVEPSADIAGMLAEALARLEDLAELPDDPHIQRRAIHALFERIEVRDRQIARIVPRPWVRPLFDLCELCAEASRSAQFTQGLWSIS